LVKRTEVQILSSLQMMIGKATQQVLSDFCFSVSMKTNRSEVQIPSSRL